MYKGYYLSYSKLFRYLYDNDIPVSKLYGFMSTATVSKLRRCKSINTNILLRICVELGVDPSEIIEIKSCDGVKVVCDD